MQDVDHPQYQNGFGRWLDLLDGHRRFRQSRAMGSGVSDAIHISGPLRVIINDLRNRQMCCQCKAFQKELEAMERNLANRIATALVTTLDVLKEMHEAAVDAGGHPVKELERLCDVFALELVDQVLFETPPNTEHHQSMLCISDDVVAAWQRAIVNL